MATPKRDVRALCATQSVPGSMKERKKKKPTTTDAETFMDTTLPADQPHPETESPAKPIEPAESKPADSLPTVEQAQAPEPSVPMSQQEPQLQQAPQAVPQYYAPIPTPVPAPVSSDWSARNPGLAQYHQYVWQVQQNPNAVDTNNPFACIMQQLQVNASRQNPSDAIAPFESEIRVPQIAPPPPQFNMGPPPPSLLATETYSMTPSHSSFAQQLPPVMGSEKPERSDTFPLLWNKSTPVRQDDVPLPQSDPETLPSNPQGVQFRPLLPRWQ